MRAALWVLALLLATLSAAFAASELRGTGEREQKLACSPKKGPTKTLADPHLNQKAEAFPRLTTSPARFRSCPQTAGAPGAITEVGKEAKIRLLPKR